MKLSITMFFIFITLFSHKAMAVDFTLGVRGGYQIAPVPTVGGEMFLHFDDFSIGISHAEGTFDISNDIDDNTLETNVTSVEATASMSLLEFRYFAFWGLNGSVGIGQRTMGLLFDIRETDNVSTLKGEILATTIVASHTFGLEWHFNWWYFAIDGVGYAYPIQTKTSAESEVSGNLSGNLEVVNDDLKDAAKEMGHVITKQLFVISFGILI